MEGKQFQQEGMNTYSLDGVKKNYEAKRITADPIFSSLYSEYEHDMKRAEHLKQMYSSHHESSETLGSTGEALVFTCIDKGALGSHVTARGTNLYDDYYHGADMVIESTSRYMRDPIISAVDVTLNQKDVNAPRRESFHSEQPLQEIGFEKKLERIKRHITYLAEIPDNKAVELSAWMQRGGLREKRNASNEKKFQEAEKLMLLKYYKNPKTVENPDQPHFVVSGPQIVLSVDSMFVNKVFSTEGSQQQKAVEALSTLIQAQVPLSIGMLKQYVEDVANSARAKGLGTNLFFASYRAACMAWEGTFLDETYQVRLDRAIKECMLDADLSKQLQYFQKTLMDILRV